MAANGFHQGAGKPNWLLNRALPVCLLLLLLALGGCPQKALPTAAKLSQAGQDTATQIQTAAILTDDQLLSIHKTLAFHNAYSDARAKRPIGSRPLDKPLLDKIDTLQKLLVADANWLTSLRNAYAALGALATYDASGNFLTAFNELSTSTTSLLTAFGKTAPPAVLSNIFQYAGEKAVAFAQTQKVIAASKAIQTELDRAIGVLSEAKIKIHYTSLQEEYIELIKLTATILIKKGVLSIKPLANDIGSTFGTVASANADKIVQGNSELQAGFCGEIMEMAKLQAQQVEKAYDKSLEASRALKKVHADLEASAQLDMTQVTAIVEQLKAIVAKITVKTAAKEN